MTAGTPYKKRKDVRAVQVPKRECFGTAGTGFLQDGWPFCCPVNIVKVLMGS